MKVLLTLPVALCCFLLQTDYIPVENKIYTTQSTPPVSNNLFDSDEILNIKLSGKIRALFDFINKRSKETDFQGCNFLNIVAEVPQSNSRIRKVIQKQKNDIRGIIKEILKEEKKEKLADPIYLLFEGALIESKVQQDDWPITTAKNTALQFL